MKFSFHIIFAMFLGLGLITSLDSCAKTQGCTDPDAENYNSDADENDGSCTYARDKFLGTYAGVLECQSPLPGNEPFTMTITESLSSNSEVLINFQEVENFVLPELSATVDGNRLVIDPERVSIPLDLNNPDLLTEVEYSGEATISGDNLSGQLSTKAVLIGLSVPCEITAVKQ